MEIFGLHNNNYQQTKTETKNNISKISHHILNYL
jgi:hypothetical protein